MHEQNRCRICTRIGASMHYQGIGVQYGCVVPVQTLPHMLQDRITPFSRCFCF
jgi:hypothetical protein